MRLLSSFAALALAGLCLLAAAPRAAAPPPDAPTIVLVPGLVVGHDDWAPTIARLGATHRVVLLDLPGHSGTPLPEPFTLEAAAARIDSALARERGARTIVVGQGVGGLLALMAVSAHPEHAAGLVLIDTQIRSPLPLAEAQRAQLVQYMDEHYDAFMTLVFSKMGRDSSDRARLLAGLARSSPPSMKAYYRQLLGVDGGPQARALERPTLLVFTQRLWQPGQSDTTIAQGLGWPDSTHATTRRIADAGYLVMRDQPDTLAAVIDAFAAEHAARH